MMTTPASRDYSEKCGLGIIKVGFFPLAKAQRNVNCRTLLGALCAFVRGLQYKVQIIYTVYDTLHYSSNRWMVSHRPAMMKTAPVNHLAGRSIPMILRNV